MGIDYFVRSFILCKQSGLIIELAKLVPHNREEMHRNSPARAAEPMLLPEPEPEPEDLSAGEVAHICMSLADNPDLTEEDVRMGIDKVKDVCRAGNSTDVFVLPDCPMSLKVFKRVIKHMSRLLRIAESYIISQLAWVEAHYFDLSNDLAAAVMEAYVVYGQCTKTSPTGSPAASPRGSFSHGAKKPDAESSVNASAGAKKKGSKRPSSRCGSKRDSSAPRAHGSTCAQSGKKHSKRPSAVKAEITKLHKDQHVIDRRPSYVAEDELDHHQLLLDDEALLEQPLIEKSSASKFCPDLNVLTGVFTLSAFSKLLCHSGLIDAHEKTGISYGEINMLFNMS